MKFLNNVEISGSLTVGGTNIKTQLSTLQTNINTANTNINTNKTNIATANTNMNKIKTYVGSDGKLHFTNASGADTALNFSSGNNLKQITCKFVVGGDSSGSARWNNFYINDTKVYSSGSYYSSSQPIKTYFNITVDLETMTIV